MSAIIKPQATQPKAIPFNRRQSQIEALAAIHAEFQSRNRASIKMACGTGKTLVGKWVCTDAGYQFNVVFVPTIALVDQLLDDWNTEDSIFNTFAVCSQDSVGQDLVDCWRVDEHELPIPVSTDPSEIRGLIDHARSRPEPLLVICTYDSAPVLASAMPTDFWFDLAEFDEAHKMAGREDGKFAFALDDRNFRARNRLFMTATPKVWDYTHETNDKETAPEAVCSMDNKQKFGRFVYEYSFRQAIDDGVICDYEVIVTVIDQSMIPGYTEGSDTVVFNGQRIPVKDAANIVALQQVMAKYDLSKAFCFHSRIESSKRMVHAAGAMIGDMEFAHIDGSMPAAKRTGILRAMERAHRYTTSNAQCLSEGVNVPNAELLALMDPVNSKEAIVQKVGRVTRKAPGKEKAYVMIPLFVDAGAGTPLRRLIGQFNNVVAVLGALKDEGGDMDALFRIGRKTAGKALTQELAIHYEGDIEGLTVNEIQGAMTQHCVRRLYPAWDGMFYALSAFKEEHERFPVNTDQEEELADLFLWCGTQRALRNAGGLSRERIDKLDSIGFPWNGRDVTFVADISAYRKFVEQHGYAPGDPSVSDKPKDLLEASEEKRLLRVLEKQRAKHMDDSLSGFRRSHLTAIGVDLGQPREDWSEDLTKLQAYMKQNGAHPTTAGRKGSKIKRLIDWHDAQVEQHENGEMPSSRAMLMQALGLLPTTVQLGKKDRRIMDQQIDDLAEFVSAYGMLPSPSAKRVPVAKLGQACLKFFELAGAGKLSNEDRVRLEEAGLFRIYPDNGLMMNLLEDYVQQYHQWPIGKADSEDDIGPLLTDWSGNMVKAYYERALPVDLHVRMLDICVAVHFRTSTLRI